MTTTITQGQLAKGRFGWQSDFVTPATSLRGFFFHQENLRQQTPREGDPVIGPGYNNSRDRRALSDGLSQHGGTMQVPLCLNQIGDWLKLIFGAPTTSNSGSDYTHVYTSGTTSLPEATIEIGLGTSDFRQHIGVVGESMRIDLKDESGVQRVDLSLLGCREDMGTSTLDGSPDSARAYVPFKKGSGGLYFGGTLVAQVLDLSWIYTTGILTERYVDASADLSAAVLANEATCNGSLRLRYTGQTVENLAIAGTAQDAEIRFVTSSTKQLVIAMPSLLLSRAGVPINGPGGVEAEHAFECQQTSGAPMVTATLKNTITSYAS